MSDPQSHEHYYEAPRDPWSQRLDQITLSCESYIKMGGVRGPVLRLLEGAIAATINSMIPEPKKETPVITLHKGGPSGKGNDN